MRKLHAFESAARASAIVFMHVYSVQYWSFIIVYVCL